MEPTYIDPDGKLVAMRAGQIVIIAGAGTRLPAPVEQLEGTYIIVVGGAGVLDDFRKWVSTAIVEDVQRALGTSWGTASRLRKALGLATVYGRKSRTTAWRRRKMLEAIDE